MGKNQNQLFRFFGGRRCWLAVSFFFNTAVHILFFENIFYRVKFWTFGRSGRKHPFGCWKIGKKKDGNSGDSGRGQADLGSASV
jgi:hypothetical protein